MSDTPMVESEDGLAGATPALATWKVFTALMTLGCCTGAFLALFGHTLRGLA